VPLLKLAFQRGEFAVEPGSAPFWMVIRREQREEGCRLVEGDVFRLGRTLFRVKHLNSDGQARPLYPDFPPPTPPILPDSDFLEPQLCRICLQDFQTSSNPLVSPCHCTGSLQFLHINCLQEWVRSHLQVRRSGSACAYLWRRLECELCKTVLSLTVWTGEEGRDLVSVDIPQGPYLILEDLRSAGNVTRGLHVVGMTEQGVCRFGRAQDCEVYISDFSVARFHATIRLNKGGFYLEDLDSKFGTALKASTRLVLPPDLTATIQTKDLVVTLKVVRPFQFRRFLCCLYGGEMEEDVSERSSEKAEGRRNLDTLSGKGEVQLADIEADKLADPGTTIRRQEEEDIPTRDFR